MGKNNIHLYHFKVLIMHREKIVNMMCNNLTKGKTLANPCRISGIQIINSI